MDRLATLPPWAVVAAGGYVLVAAARLFGRAWTPATASKSINRVVRRGLLVVNAPMLLLILGMPALALFYLGYETGTLVAVAAGIVLAGLWRSIVAPHWRLRAYRTTNDVQVLTRRAFAVGLILPARHPLAHQTRSAKWCFDPEPSSTTVRYLPSKIGLNSYVQCNNAIRSP